MRDTFHLRPRILGYRKDGRPIFSIAGASPDDPSNNPTPDPAPAPLTDPAPSDPKPDDGKTFTQADVERIIAGRLSKYADYDDVKKQLTDIQKANETETEKAINAAKEEARKGALAEATPRLVEAEFRAAAAGRMTAEQLKELTEDLDMSKYLTDSGEVDVERITKKIDALAPAKEERKAAPTFGGGPRKTSDKQESTPGLGRLRDAYASSSK
jgi:hypothetical protein